MPDQRSPMSAPTPSWGEAFAALPLETPDAGGWQRVERTRPRPARVRWAALTAAIAAALAVIALSPLQLSRRERQVDVPRADQSAAVSASVLRDPSADPTRGETAMRRVPVERAIAIASAPASGATDPARRADHGPRAGGVSATAPDAETGVARAPVDPDAATRGPAVTGGGATPAPATDELERLYAQSAQLEALLSLARDERVSSGTAAALGSDFDAQVAAIDAELVQPAITRERRIQLWRDRVDALRQVTAFESTQRLLAAQGERYDARLVSVD